MTTKIIKFKEILLEIEIGNGVKLTIMPVSSRAMLPSTASQFMIWISQYTDFQLSGRMHNPYTGYEKDFSDVIEMTHKMDYLFDTLAFPQATTIYRKFSEVEHTLAESSIRLRPRDVKERVTEAVDEKRESDSSDNNSDSDRDIFVVHVKYRQNSTWQGTIKWAAKGQSMQFRSTLEMLKLMDNALASAHSESET